MNAAKINANNIFTFQKRYYLRFMATKKAKQEKDTRDEIVDHLKSDDRRLTWLSKKTKIPYATLNSILYRKERSLQEHHLLLINKVLGTDFNI